jgi:hypothetical protein
LLDIAVSQICDVRLLTGEADVMMRFDQDEWYALSGGELVNITFPDDNLSVFNQMSNPHLHHSEYLYFDEIAQVMEKSKHKWQRLVNWVQTTFNDMLDGAESHSPNPYLDVWYRLKYGSENGIYDVHHTDRGMLSF